MASVAGLVDLHVVRARAATIEARAAAAGAFLVSVADLARAAAGVARLVGPQVVHYGRAARESPTRNRVLPREVEVSIGDVGDGHLVREVEIAVQPSSGRAWVVGEVEVTAHTGGDGRVRGEEGIGGGAVERPLDVVVVRAGGRWQAARRRRGDAAGHIDQLRLADRRFHAASVIRLLGERIGGIGS